MLRRAHSLESSNSVWKAVKEGFLFARDTILAKSHLQLNVPGGKRPPVFVERVSIPATNRSRPFEPQPSALTNTRTR